MSSAIYVKFDQEEGIDAARWQAFCGAHGIAHSPRTVGGNVFYAGDVEVTFGEGLPGRIPEYAEHVTFSTYFLGPAVPEVADLARAFWLEFGGAVEAAEELRGLFASDRERRA